MASPSPSWILPLVDDEELNEAWVTHPHHAAPVSSRQFEKCFKHASAVFGDDNRNNVGDIHFSIDLQQQGGRFGFRIAEVGWLGNVVYRMRAAMKFPPRSTVQQYVLPRAEEILQQARTGLHPSEEPKTDVSRPRRTVRDKSVPTRTQRMKGFTSGSLGFSSSFAYFQLAGKNDANSSVSSHVMEWDVSPVKLAVEGALRFLLDQQNEKAKELLLLAMRKLQELQEKSGGVHPKSRPRQDLRLYKLLSWPYLHDRSNNRRLGINEYHLLLQTIRKPDPELWAICGEVSRCAWELEKDNFTLAERAISYYGNAFLLSKNSSWTSLGFTCVRAASLCSELYATEARNGNKLWSLYKIKGQQFLKALLGFLKKWVEVAPEMRENRYYYFNLAFAHFGLKQYDEAQEAIKHFSSALYSERSDPVMVEHQLKHDLSQLIRILLFSGASIPVADEKWPPCWESLRDLFRTQGVELTAGIIQGILRGRVGLAFSGGGLRAAFIHLGVLARLAECDVLRSVEAISSTSGGSLVCALYYQLTKHLIGTRPDREITREHYLAIIHTMINIFLKGVTCDFHNAVYANPWKNLLAEFGVLTRSDLLVEHWHHEFYSWDFERTPLAPPLHGAVRLKRKVLCRELPILPFEWNKTYGFDSFHPTAHNWRREAKAPALYLNCTTLNTGHLWRFTPTYMGESRDIANNGLDDNLLLEVVKYEDCELKRHRDFTFARAVTCSVCVPGFFQPVEIRGLYFLNDLILKNAWGRRTPKDLTVKLVDGGVNDNYGLYSLVHARSNFILLSDGSMHLADEFRPSSQYSMAGRRCLFVTMDLEYKRLAQSLIQQDKDRWDRLAAKSECENWKLVPPLVKHQDEDDLQLEVEGKGGGGAEASKRGGWLPQRATAVADEVIFGIEELWDGLTTLVDSSPMLSLSMPNQKSLSLSSSPFPPSAPPASSSSNSSSSAFPPTLSAATLSHSLSQIPKLEDCGLESEAIHSSADLRQPSAVFDAWHEAKTYQDKAHDAGPGSDGKRDWLSNVARLEVQSLKEARNRLGLHDHRNFSGDRLLLQLCIDLCAHTRTALDWFNETEACSIMAVGYIMCEEALATASTDSLDQKESQSMRMKSMDDTSAGKQNAQDFRQSIFGDISMLKKQAGWGNFDMDAPETRAWQFSPYKDLILQEDPDSDNPAVQALLDILSTSGLHWGSQRVFARHKCLGYFLVALLASVFPLLFGFFWKSWFESYAKNPNCRCFAQGPEYWLALVLSLFFLLWKPGYLRHVVLAIVAWLLSWFHIFGFDAYLAAKGSSEHIIGLYNRHQDKFSLKIYTPMQLQQGGRMCHNCGKLTREPKRCASCRDAFYCSARCQRQAWPKHAKSCKERHQKMEAKGRVRVS
eukprot:g7413.t1